MSDPKPLSDEEREEQRLVHREATDGMCHECGWRWPCPVVRLLAERDALNEAIDKALRILERGVPGLGEAFGDE